MDNILEDLKRYFRDTSPEQIALDWAETEKYDAVGPTVEEFLKTSKMFFKIKDYDIQKKGKKCIILANPKLNLRVLCF